MPLRKLLYSGSNAELASLRVDNAVSASQFSGSFFGNGAGITGVISSSFAISASWAPPVPSVSASYALTASYFDGMSHAVFSQPTTAVTWSFTHNLNNETPNITVWNSDKEVVVPEKIQSVNGNLLRIFFPFSASGYAIASNGSILQSAATVVSSSYALTASFVSLANSASHAIAAKSASYAETSSFSTQTFSRGGSVADVANGISTTGSYYVWRCPHTCQVTALYGKKSGTGTSQVNARKSGSAGYLYHTGSNILLPTADLWVSANTVSNTNYASGDSLEIIITGSGATQIAVQVDFIRI